MKHIVLSCDLTDRVERVVPQVITLAESLGAHVTLLHVVQVLTAVQSGGMLTTPPIPPDPDADRNRAVKQLKEVAEGFPKSIEVHTEVVLSDDVPRAISQWAEENDADLIVMPTHGRSGLRRIFLGSVAEGVLRSSKVSVLCAPLQN